MHKALSAVPPAKLAATLAMHDEGLPRASCPDFRFPPCVIMKRGRTLREWCAEDASRSTGDKLMVRLDLDLLPADGPNSECCRWR